jgi:hypothetical protein
MNIYEDYIKTREAIEALQTKLKGLDEQILEEVKHLSEPYKTDKGTFTKVVSKKWTYSPEYLITEANINLEMKPLQEQIKNKQLALKELQKLEQQANKAKAEEYVSLRFIPVKK